MLCRRSFHWMYIASLYLRCCYGNAGRITSQLIKEIQRGSVLASTPHRKYRGSFTPVSQPYLSQVEYQIRRYQDKMSKQVRNRGTVLRLTYHWIVGRGSCVSVFFGTWGERRYSSCSLLTSALEGGEWSASRPGRPLPPVPTVQEAGWAPEPVWTQRLEEKCSACVGDRTPGVQSIVTHCTGWAIESRRGWLARPLKKTYEAFYVISVV
jgi:hypothetical protein